MNDRLKMHNCILAVGDNIGLAFEQVGVSNDEGDYDLFHNDNPNRVIAVAYTDEFTLNQLTNGEWATYSGQDAHSLVDNSYLNLFFNPVNFDLHLIESSLAVDHVRSDFEPPIDFEGKAKLIGNRFDIEAYEYSSLVSVKYNKEAFDFSKSFYIFQNYPNSFTSKTLIVHQLNKSLTAEIEIFNIYGQLIWNWQNIQPGMGEFKLSWNARDNSGKLIHLVNIYAGWDLELTIRSSNLSTKNRSQSLENNLLKQPSSRTCFICGKQNEFGLQMEWNNNLETNQVEGTVSVPEHFNGYPGIVHGGIIAAILDETAGRAVLLDGNFDNLFVTLKLEITYRNFTPTNTPLKAVGWLVSEGNRSRKVAAELRLPDGSVSAECQSVIVRPPDEISRLWEPERPFWRVYGEK